MKARKKTKGIFSVKSSPVDPASMPQPANPTDYSLRAMSFYARKNYDKAIEDFSKATSMDPASEDAFYGLGMAYKAAGKKDDSILAFQTVIRLLADNLSESNDHKVMLRRLALGHINEMVTGDWNLEKEIWKHIP